MGCRDVNDKQGYAINCNKQTDFVEDHNSVG